MRRMFICPFVLFCFALDCAGGVDSFTVSTRLPLDVKVEMVFRAPTGFESGAYQKETYGIMVLFGGRNWSGGKTIKSFGFGELADRFHLFLLSPSFKDDEYWRPEKWSGAALLAGIETLKRRHAVRWREKVIYYGYSAGGQCAALFHHWKPGIVLAWGAHACGVYEGWAAGAAGRLSKAPFLLTCGENDRGRWHITSRFVQRARRLGARSVWKSFSETGHELNTAALELARLFFVSVLAEKAVVRYVGDDQTGRFWKSGSRRTAVVDIEERSVFFDLSTVEFWVRRRGRTDRARER